MKTLFYEEDLVSFGTYLLSKERKEDYAKQLEVDKISEFLSKVNPYDLQMWANEANKNKKNNEVKDTPETIIETTDESTNSK